MRTRRGVRPPPAPRGSGQPLLQPWPKERMLRVPLGSPPPCRGGIAVGDKDARTAGLAGSGSAARPRPRPAAAPPTFTQWPGGQGGKAGAPKREAHPSGTNLHGSARASGGFRRSGGCPAPPAQPRSPEVRGDTPLVAPPAPRPDARLQHLGRRLAPPRPPPPPAAPAAMPARPCGDRTRPPDEEPWPPGGSAPRAAGIPGPPHHLASPRARRPSSSASRGGRFRFGRLPGRAPPPPGPGAASRTRRAGGRGRRRGDRPP